MILLGDELGAILTAGKTPRILLHCCCAPCACYVLEYLSPLFEITVFFYNPNIRPREEYDKREAELVRLLSLAEYQNSAQIIKTDYGFSSFDAVAEPFLDEPEGGRRCRACFELRLSETARRAKEDSFEYFATTLSVSPHKNAKLLNEIGGELEGEYGVKYLHADFKKRNGYMRSVELSKQFGLYRQSYCGCAVKVEN